MCGSVGWVGTPHASSFNKFKIFNKLLAFENGLERSDEVQRESRKTALVEKKISAFNSADNANCDCRGGTKISEMRNTLLAHTF